MSDRPGVVAALSPQVQLHCKPTAFRQYLLLIPMDDSRRERVGDLADSDMSDVKGVAAGKPHEAAAPAPESTPAPKNTAAPSKPPPQFVGQAMKSLFESADVSIRRDDETRVMSRAQVAVEDLQRRTGIVISDEPAHGSESGAPEPRTTSSAPPGPRVDVVLWIVLAAGLFTIAGWMLMYGL